MFRSFNGAREVMARGYAKAGAALAGLILSTMAQAEVTMPAGATQLFTDTALLFALVLAAAYVLMLAITGGWITFDIVKKGAKKAAK